MAIKASITWDEDEYDFLVKQVGKQNSKRNQTRKNNAYVKSLVNLIRTGTIVVVENPEEMAEMLTESKWQDIDELRKKRLDRMVAVIPPEMVQTRNDLMAELKEKLVLVEDSKEDREEVIEATKVIDKALNL